MTSWKATRLIMAALLAVGLMPGTVAAQLMTKPQVANLIGKVENGVDQFRDYLKQRVENAQAASSTPDAQNRRARRGAATDFQKATANARPVKPNGIPG